MWLDEKEQSRCFYHHCLELHKQGKKDVDELWKLITDETYKFLYYLYIKNAKGGC